MSFLRNCAAVTVGFVVFAACLGLTAAASGGLPLWAIFAGAAFWAVLLIRRRAARRGGLLAPVDPGAAQFSPFHGQGGK